MRSIRLLVITLLGISSVASAQDKVFFSGFFPEIALSKKLSDKLYSTLKVESQHIQYDNRQPEGTLWQYAHYRTDIQGFLATKLNPFWKISVGYQYRLNGGGSPDYHRFIQQVAYVQRFSKIRLGHRLRFDQTFTNDSEESTEFRIRYRTSVELPLSGQSLDPGEFYLLLSNELILSTQSGDEEIENRLVCSFGHYFNKKMKLEAGPDWRTDKFIGAGFRHRLWFKIGCFLNL